MAHVAYLTVRGKTQGTFKGEGTKRGNGRIRLVSFEMDVASPRDAASGQASGKRQYQPLVIRKEIDAASPQFLQAVATNEVLVSVEIEFLAGDSDGEEAVVYTVELTNAAAVTFGQSVDTAETGGPLVDTRLLERISFTFQRITVSNVAGETSFSDDWTVST
jgi:type VI secretion system secreted protein Hcp